MTKEFRDHTENLYGKTVKFVFLDGKSLTGELIRTLRYEYKVKANGTEIFVHKHAIKYYYQTAPKG